jgi:prepilin-type N-terminal cleavage/methylation domain-containing protein
MTQLRTVQHRRRPSPRRRIGSRSAFTLIELLVAISVIAILIAIIAFAAPAIFTSEQRKQAEAALAALDRALQEYEATQGRFPEVDDGLLNRYEETFNAADGLDPGPRADDDPVTPDAWLFLEPARGFGSVDDVLASVPGSFRRTTFARIDGDDTPIPQFIDPWGAAILYIHPSMSLAQQLYGRCPNRRPYFMSAGPDGFYGLGSEVEGQVGAGASQDELAAAAAAALGDNVYSAQPAVATETDDDVRTVY